MRELDGQRRIFVLALAAVVLAFGISACGNSNSSSATSSGSSEAGSTSGAAGKSGSSGGLVDVGGGMSVPLSVGEMKIAFISSSLSVPLGMQQQQGVETVAAKYGIPVKTFDGEFDVARQLGLYQTIIDSGEYNAIVTLPLGGDQDCEILSKTAPEKGIVVSILNTPICGHEFASAKGDGLWAEGTLDTVGVVFNRNGLDAWGKACASYTGGGKAILLNGQAGTPNFETLTKGFEAGGFELVSNYATDYLASEAVEKTNAALLAHPDLNVIATTAPQMTEGAIQALKSSGKQPGVDVKVCNILGGSETMIDLVKSGEVTVDAYANDGWSAIAATQSIIDAAEGRPAPRVIVPGQDGKIVKSGTVPWPPVYTEESANRYEPNGE